MASKIQIRRDTASNWTATNPILSQGEPGLETDTSKVKYGDGATRWAALPYAGGGAGVTARNSIGWVNAFGPIPNNDTDYWFSSVIADAGNNSYFGGSNYDGSVPLVVKFDANGDVAWQTDLGGAFDGYEGAVTSLDFDTNSANIVIVAEYWSGGNPGPDEGNLVYVLDHATGEVVNQFATKIRDDNQAVAADGYVEQTGAWVEAQDIIVNTSGTFIVSGTKHGVPKFYNIVWSTDTVQDYNAVDVMTVSASKFPDDVFPSAYNNWQLESSALISGSRWISSVNYWEQSNSTAGPGSTGSGATFNFSWRPQTGKLTGTTSSVWTYDWGMNYQVGDTITVDARDCGSAFTCTITVTAINVDYGYIYDFTHNWVPDTSRIKLKIDSGGWDFANTSTNSTATWQLIEYTNDQGFIYSQDGWAREIGQQQGDYLTAMAGDADNNIYVVGKSYMDTNDGNDWTGFLMKLDSTGEKLWAKNYDFYNYEGNDYTGVVVDSANNVIVVGEQLVTKVDSTGAVLWQKSIGYSDMMNNYNACVDVDSSNNIYFVAESSSVYFPDDSFLVVKLDSDGNEVWQGVVGSSGDENTNWNNGFQINAVTDDYIFIAGSTSFYSTQNEIALAIAVPTAGFTADASINEFYFFKQSTYTITTASSVMGALRHGPANISVTTGSFTITTSTAISNTTTYAVLKMPAYDNQGGELAGVRHLTFEDGTTQTTAATAGSPVSLGGYVDGDSSYYFRLGDANKTVVVDNSNGWYDSWLYVPATYHVAFPAGTIITIVLKSTVGYRTWLNNDGNSDVQIHADGFEGGHYWQLNQSGEYGNFIYKLQLVERLIDGANNDWWILSGGVYPDSNGTLTYAID